jgi:hypothetical protein
MLAQTENQNTQTQNRQQKIIKEINSIGAVKKKEEIDADMQIAPSQFFPILFFGIEHYFQA